MDDYQEGSFVCDRVKMAELKRRLAELGEKLSRVPEEILINDSRYTLYEAFASKFGIEHISMELQKISFEFSGALADHSYPPFQEPFEYYHDSPDS